MKRRPTNLWMLIEWRTPTPTVISAFINKQDADDGLDLWRGLNEKWPVSVEMVSIREPWAHAALADDARLMDILAGDWSRVRRPVTADAQALATDLLSARAQIAALTCALEAICGLNPKYEGMKFSDREAMVNAALGRPSP